MFNLQRNSGKFYKFGIILNIKQPTNYWNELAIKDYFLIITYSQITNSTTTKRSSVREQIVSTLDIA